MPADSTVELLRTPLHFAVYARLPEQPVGATIGPRKISMTDSPPKSDSVPTAISSAPPVPPRRTWTMLRSPCSVNASVSVSPVQEIALGRVGAG